jgi:hypothetical protein
MQASHYQPIFLTLPPLGNLLVPGQTPSVALYSKRPNRLFRQPFAQNLADSKRRGDQDFSRRFGALVVSPE